MEASTVILGISPGTRTMGLAVIRRGELIEWRVKTFKGPWSKDKLKFILGVIEKAIDYFEVTQVAIKKVAPCRSSKQLCILTNRLIVLSKRKKLQVTTYSLPELVQATGRKQRNLHHAIAEYLLGIYPSLRKEYLKERNLEREYYSKMFEAVMCAYLQGVADRDFQ